MGFLQNIDLGTIAVQFAVLLFSLSIHEAAHAWMADRRGDYTARYMGRVTLNPLAHIDPVGTVLFPLIMLFTGIPLIGWAKPVPTNPLHLKDPARDQMGISFAGPAANLVAGGGAFVLLLLAKHAVPGAWNHMLYWMAPRYFVGEPSVVTPVMGMLFYLMVINLMLAIFNLIPIPPLDGHWIVAGLLPPRAAESFRRFGTYGIFLLYALMVLGVLRVLTIPVWWLVAFLGVW
ncbi:MAG: site-2 protease family protein [Acidobacteriota bacterium]|nr:site-2 protease family protein [Acidobacteriota bacterium]